MTKKDELIKLASDKGASLTGDETIADLEKILKDLEAASEEGDTALRAAKVNRGSRRRIERAATEFNSQISKTLKELDALAYIADDNGERVAEWPVLSALREAQQLVNDEINSLLAAK